MLAGLLGKYSCVLQLCTAVVYCSLSCQGVQGVKQSSYEKKQGQETQGSEDFGA